MEASWCLCCCCEEGEEGEVSSEQHVVRFQETKSEGGPEGTRGEEAAVTKAGSARDERGRARGKLASLGVRALRVWVA